VYVLVCVIMVIVALAIDELAVGISGTFYSSFDFGWQETCSSLGGCVNSCDADSGGDACVGGRGWMFCNIVALLTAVGSYIGGNFVGMLNKRWEQAGYWGSAFWVGLGVCLGLLIVAGDSDYLEMGLSIYLGIFNIILFIIAMGLACFTANDNLVEPANYKAGPLTACCCLLNCYCCGFALPLDQLPALNTE